jgi:uncharacterized repeat protein (TIGR01451 family)
MLLAVLLPVMPVLAPALDCATPMDDGSGNTGGTFTPPASATPPATTTLGAGATSLPYSATSGTIAAGDMLLVIQMQDAAINANNTDAYGDGVNDDLNGGTNTNFDGIATGWTNLNNTGWYEFVEASGPPSGGSIPIFGNLQRTYRNGNTGAGYGQRRFQIIKVPQYQNLTLTANLLASPWNGSSGGVVVLDVSGEMNFAGHTVDASARGFRGGASRNLAGAGGGANTDYRTTATTNRNGQKGEGVAGTPRYAWNYILATTTDSGVEGYQNGSSARGAPGNAGGGGTDGDPANNDENTGGGGGGNGSRGGYGGNSWSSNVAAGGHPGETFPASIDRIVMGGGGGAPSSNNAANGTASGGAGGGIVIIRAGRISGNGIINANGGNGLTGTPANDGGGGGGAGGSVIVIANQQSGSLTVNANGGNGGNADPGGAAHGPGGGGGAGVVFTSPNVVASINTNPGANGTTAGGIPFGASPSPGGSTPSTNNDPASVPGVSAGWECSQPALTLVKSSNRTTVDPGQQITYSVNVSNSGEGVAKNVWVNDQLPPMLRFVPDSFGPGQHFELVQGSPVSGLSLGAPEYSTDGGSNWLPFAGAPPAFEENLTNFRVPLTGDFANGGADFTLRYRAQAR